MKEGIFVCPQIAQVFKEQRFGKILNSTKITAQKAFENICRNLHGNAKAKNYSQTVQQLITLHSAEECI
jgi:UDP-N-acetylglucosamine:LPS N-acetylglucosamine transferase